MSLAVRSSMEIKGDKVDSALTWAAIGLAALTLPTLAGCDLGASAPSSAQSTPTARMNPAERAATKSERLSSVVDVGFGIYVFPVGKEFAETLADFKEAHPELKITSVTQGPDETHGMLDQTYARSNSFIIVTERASTAEINSFK